MPPFKSPTVADRRAAADAARKAALQKFKAVPGPGTPEFEARQKELIARDEARKLSDLTRAKAKAERDAAEELRRVEEVRLAAEAAERARADEIARLEELERQRKAARDARYAARKAAKQKTKGGKVPQRESA